MLYSLNVKYVVVGAVCVRGVRARHAHQPLPHSRLPAPFFLSVGVAALITEAHHVLSNFRKAARNTASNAFIFSTGLRNSKRVYISAPYPIKF